MLTCTKCNSIFLEEDGFQVGDICQYQCDSTLVLVKPGEEHPCEKCSRGVEADKDGCEMQIRGKCSDWDVYQRYLINQENKSSGLMTNVEVIVDLLSEYERVDELKTLIIEAENLGITVGQHLLAGVNPEYYEKINDTYYKRVQK